MKKDLCGYTFMILRREVGVEGVDVSLGVGSFLYNPAHSRQNLLSRCERANSWFFSPIDPRCDRSSQSTTKQKQQQQQQQHHEKRSTISLSVIIDVFDSVLRFGTFERVDASLVFGACRIGRPLDGPPHSLPWFHLCARHGRK